MCARVCVKKLVYCLRGSAVASTTAGALVGPCGPCTYTTPSTAQRLSDEFFRRIDFFFLLFLLLLLLLVGGVSAAKGFAGTTLAAL